MQSVSILFLDIDGVLNCSSTGYSPLGVRDIDDDKLCLLKEIIDQTKAKILLISSWKDEWYRDPAKKSLQSDTANYLDEKFAQYGLKLFGKVPDVDFGGRGKSIREYLRRVREKGIEVPHFAILDDHADDYAKMGLADRLVKTNYAKGGLTRAKALKVIALLK